MGRQVKTPDTIDDVALSADEAVLWRSAPPGDADQAVRQRRLDVIAAHEEAAKAPRNEEGLRLDGPTKAEYVAAGYNAESYPPAGYAARPDEPLPEAVVGFEELALRGAIAPPPPRGRCPEMPDDWWPDEVRFEMRTRSLAGSGRVALGAMVSADDDPSGIFAKLRYALWQAANGICQEGVRTSTHCLDCGAPAWAAVPNRVGKPGG